MVRPPVSTPDDKRYIRSEFIELSELCSAMGADIEALRHEIAIGIRPQPAYVLDDGAEFVARDYLSLETDKTRFEARLHARAVELGVPMHEVARIWAEYLGGGFGICLIHVSPESIVEKEFHISRIAELTEGNIPLGEHDRNALRRHVDALDALERPFCAYDRAIFGGSVSRDRFITEIRKRYDLPWCGS